MKRPSNWRNSLCLATATTLAACSGAARVRAKVAPDEATTGSRELCFGGAPQVMASEVGMTYRLAEGRALWTEYQDLASLDLATAKKTWTRFGRPMVMKGVLGSEVFGVEDNHETTTGNTLFAVDFHTGKERTLLEGTLGEEHLVWSPYVVDGADLYLIRGPYGHRPMPGEKISKFVRLRSGQGEPEFLGYEPQGVYTQFRIADGFVYWNRPVGPDAFELSRRAIALDSPVQRLAATREQYIDLAVANGRVYYLDDGVLSSVAADGSSGPIQWTDRTGTRAKHLLVDRACAYFSNDRGIQRIRIDGKAPAVPERIVDDGQFSNSELFLEGEILHWRSPDGKIVRLARNSRALPVEPPLVAKPAVLESLPPDAAGKDSRLVVGDGWGCARVFGWQQPHWQCWSAPATTASAHVAARTVPWLSASELRNGPDKLCFLSKSADLCWMWPELATVTPANAPQDKDQIQSSKEGQLLIGGTFACTIQYVGSERMLDCSGDNAYGQRAERDQPIMLEPWRGVAGTWHGCVSYDDIYCWGRGDAGQLGFQPEDTCAVAGSDVPCSKDVHKTGLKLGNAEMVAGDMFTCAKVGYPSKFYCWGGSRDGWFGGQDCPAALREAWPTTNGVVPAPHAKCSRMPVAVPELDGLTGEIAVGPRGACVVVDGHLRCLGAIPTPSIEVGRVRVSPGVRASACGIADSRVLCWGEDYSPTDKPGQPLAIEFSATPPMSAVVDFPPPDGKAWPKERRIHRGCSAPRPIPKCAPELKGSSWASIRPRAPSLRDQAVVVQDRLLVGPGGKSARAVVVGEGDRPLHFWGLGNTPSCGGDESRLCCNTPAFGQTVVVKGVLTGSNENGWGLQNPELCELP
jgi:hypothetical protein